MPTPDPVTAVSSLGGIALVRSVRACGVSKDAIQRAVTLRGTLVRPRYGMVALPTAPRAILRAAAAGGALAGPSAADYYGLWTPSSRQLHISVRSDAVRRRNPQVVLIRDGHHLRPDEGFVVSLETCVRQCIRLLPFDEAVAVVDSALHRELTTATATLDMDRLRSQLPARLHPVLDTADPRSEAGAETLARVRLRRLGIVAHPQRWITRGIRVDLLIGDRLVVEIGSVAFHAHPDAYESDHSRSAVLLALGCDVLEFTTSQVMDDWPFVEGIILDHVGRATHQ